MDDNEISFLEVRSEWRMLKIPYKNIMYIESKKSYVIVHTLCEKIVCNTPFRLIISQLSKNLFVQTHPKIIVAISQIDMLESSRVTLVNKETVSLSKIFREKVVDLMLKLGMIDK